MTDTAKDESKYIAEGRGRGERKWQRRPQTHLNQIYCKDRDGERGERETETYAYALKCR